MKKSRFSLVLQLHGGGGHHDDGGSSQAVAEASKRSAPQSMAAPTIETATEQSKQDLRDRLRAASGKRATNKTGSSVNSQALNELKKNLLGE